MYIQTFMYWTLAAILQCYTRPDINKLTGGDRVLPDTIAMLVSDFNTYAQRYLSVFKQSQKPGAEDSVPELVLKASSGLRFGTLKELPEDEEHELRLLLDKMYHANFDMVSHGSAIAVTYDYYTLFNRSPEELGMSPFGVEPPKGGEPYLGVFSEEDKRIASEVCKARGLNGVSFIPSEMRMRRISFFDPMGKPALHEGEDPLGSHYPIELIVDAAEHSSIKSLSEKYTSERNRVTSQKHLPKIGSTKKMEIKF